MRRLPSSLAIVLFVAGLTGAMVVAQRAGGAGAGAPPDQQAGRAGGGGRGGGVPLQPNGECPAGMTEVRAGRCQTPGLPAPTIVDYRPRTTMVTAQNMRPRAKFPVIDIHNHTGISANNIDQMIREMDELNLRVLVRLGGGSTGPAVQQGVDFLNSTPHKDRFRIFATVQWNGAGGAGWGEKAVADLEAAVKAGAIGLKIGKGLGLDSRKADGSRLKVDDPDLKPIWDTCARLNIPVIIHTAEPQEFFSPLDHHNERWLELALFENRRNDPAGKPPDDKYGPLPSFEQLMGERDRMYSASPKTRYIGAHFNWYANNLARAAKQLDELPNLVLELGAVLYDFGRQPRAAREFFIKYQDRILFGKDSFEVTEFPYYWRVFETNDEYFDYYPRNYHAFWKMYGMGLPDEVLKKVYYKNALRVTPGLPQNGWPR